MNHHDQHHHDQHHHHQDHHPELQQEHHSREQELRAEQGPNWRASPGFGPRLQAGFGPTPRGGFRPGFAGPADPNDFPGDPGDRPHRRGRGRGRGDRAGRGDVRNAVLVLLQERPMHGYQLIQEISQRSEGAWRPSPGALYPALNLLQDEGLISITEEGGRRLATLTPAGVQLVTEQAEQLGKPWETETRGEHPGRDLRSELHALAGAAMQLGRSGTDEQIAEAVAELRKLRRAFYLMLAGDEPEPNPDQKP